MNDTIRNTFSILNSIPYYIKMIISSFIIIGSFVGVVIAVEDRYVDQQEIAQTLSQFDNKINQDLMRIDLRILNMQYDSYTEQYFKAREELKKFPDDADITEEVNYYKILREKTKGEINKIIK